MTALDTERGDKAETTVASAAAGALAVAFVVGVVVAGGVRHFLLDVYTINMEA